MNIPDIAPQGFLTFPTAKRYRYITRHQYGDWKAGTRVIAYRALRTDELCIEFPDGTTAVLNPTRHLEGVEPHRQSYLTPLEPGELLCR